MTQKLIIIRGNSGSGKTTIAKRLQLQLGYGTMLIPQDVVRREILRTPDTPNNDAVELMYDMAMYGHKKGYVVILEGILSKQKYSTMLQRLITDFGGNAQVYYLDIPFEETLRRHATKAGRQGREFGEKQMREWWIEKDYLGLKDEIILGPELSVDELVERLVLDALS